MDQTIAILGGGNLGKAIALGLASTGEYKPEEIIVTRRKAQGIDSLSEQSIQATTNNREAVAKATLVFVCVQPKQLPELLHEIADVLNSRQHVLVSTVTGVKIEEIEEIVGPNFPIVRAMPNTAIAIRESMTTIAAKNTEAGKLEKIKSIFDILGRTLIIDENLMAAATVLGASGIAFCLRYIRAAAQGGIQMGFHAEEAQEIAVQTCRGAASLLLQEGNHPEKEIDKVTTPQGCTIAGLNEMEHNGLSSAVIKGIMTSFERIANIRN